MSHAHRPAAPWLVISMLAVALVTVSPVATVGTHARFTDTAVVTTGSMAAGSLAPVTGLQCATLNAATSIRFSWTGSAPQYGYRIVTNTTNQLVISGVVDQSSFQRDGLLTLGGALRFEVWGQVPGSSWVGPVVTRTFGQGLLGLTGFSC